MQKPDAFHLTSEQFFSREVLEIQVSAKNLITAFSGHKLTVCETFRFFSNLVGEEGPGNQGVKSLLSKDFIIVLSILSTSAIKAWIF
jgi:hypothetical protein